MLLVCGWQKCLGCSSLLGLGELQGTGQPEAPKPGLYVLPSPYPWVLQGSSSPGSQRSCPGGLRAPRTWEQSLPTVLASQSVVHSSSCLQVPGGHEQSFFWDCCRSSPCNLALLPGKRPFPGREWDKNPILLDFFLPVSAVLSSYCPLQSQMKAHGTGCICNSAGTGSSLEAPQIIFNTGCQQLCNPGGLRGKPGSGPWALKHPLSQKPGDDHAHSSSKTRKTWI